MIDVTTQAIKSTEQQRPNKKGNRERVDEFRRIVRQQTGRPTSHRRRRRISRGAFLALGGTAAAGFALGEAWRTAGTGS
jgi:hypothetical protein